ncbi:SNAP25 ous protein SNAP33 [Tripterygium wilfordii]|uniref:SNAP25 ous protein SNAP33 n=1 Tax=Tripterygium wilfordii TaxID=458696 RepID=A0A7J7CJB7_TRIWF|nr:SNAP25 homologous protein SNAP33 [Tripterygium wilfordii]KAF5734129.1 SNAP25 ous protein SNAP33 [Tripterygium wilfordii]
MFSSKKSPIKVAKPGSAKPGYHVSSHTNPFDSDDELDNKQAIKPSRKKSSEPTLVAPNLSSNPFDDDMHKVNSSSSSYSLASAGKNSYKNDFSDSGGLENQSVQELENYAVYRAEETTKTVNNLLKIAGDIREDATKTLVTLHHQGEQITRTHNVAIELDHDLSRGEKLLGSLGGMFSKTWKPKKTRPITGPIITKDDHPPRRTANDLQERERLGLNSAPKARSNVRTSSPESTGALQKVEVEKAKQDDALADLSNCLDELKDMAIDMRSEIEWQNGALEPVHVDVEEINSRMKGANQRGQRLLGK